LENKQVAAIHFSTAEVTFLLKQKKILKHWIFNTAKLHACKIIQIDFIFCSDNYLLSINQQFLSHDTYTDIITFDYTAVNKNKTKAIVSEIYISIERVKENAKTFKTNYTKELHRVMIHGVLHLCGFKDKKIVDKQLIRSKEDEALIRLDVLFMV